MDIPVSIIVPTYNAGAEFKKFAEMAKKQTANIKQVLVIDSSSTDQTADIAKSFGFDVEIIAKSDFGHGKTRQYALDKITTEIAVFLTQDALLYDEFAVEKLVDCLTSDDKIATAYGRQVPYPDTGILGKFARLYNYPEISKINTFEDRKVKGIKITERHEHGKEVGYVKMGDDATVAYNTLDLKFKNNTNNDIKLLVEVTKDKVIAKILKLEY